MKHFATLLLFVGFSGMAVFGLFVMDMTMEHDLSGCIASQVTGNQTVCPMDIMQMAFHHISVFQTFSLSSDVFTNSVYSALIAFLFVFSLLFVLILFFRPPILRRKFVSMRESIFFHLQKISEWLSLFENSPSFIK